MSEDDRQKHIAELRAIALEAKAEIATWSEREQRTNFVPASLREELAATPQVKAVYTIKQVILARTDLNMRKGKLAAQVAHASMKVFFDRQMIYLPNTESFEPVHGEGWKVDSALMVDLTPEMTAWVNGSFAKIVLGVSTEADLLEALRLAKEAGIPCALITDAGNTEFHGVPTNTCVAIGPAKSTDIDLITGPSGAIKTRLL